MEDKTNEIVKLLNQFPFFKTIAFTSWFGIPNSTLQMAVKGKRKIPQKHQAKLLQFLSDFTNITFSNTHQ